MERGISEVNFVLGNRCNSECSHCFSMSTPNSGERMDRDTALAYAKQIKEIPSIKTIQFNGGEPFLYLKLMSDVISLASPNGEKTIKIATGAAEFKTMQLAKRMLEMVNQASELWVSIDPYHLKKSSVQNYKNLNSVAKEMNISIVYSISFASLKELAETLTIIKQADLTYRKIAKQPVFKYGNAESLKQARECFSAQIPMDFKCGETDIATIWPDGQITNCSAFAGRSGYTPRYNSLNDFLSKNDQDPFFQLRKSCSMKEIAKKLNVSGEFNVTSACATCKNILERTASKKSDSKAC